MILADDSGLTVDILGGAPGVYSARFAGEHGDDRKNNEKLLSMLQGTPKEKRTAKFVCAMVLITEDNKVIKVQGEVDGYVQEELLGAAGFGYDPLFYVPDYNMTFAEMSEEQKNIISHRAKALSKLKNEISSVI
jgi:XTP/dITP diphosphohydrolase